MLGEMEKALKENKTLEKLTFWDDDDSHPPLHLPNEFCRHVLLGTRQSASLSDVRLDFDPQTWDCPDVGRLIDACQSHSVTLLDVVYNVYQAISEDVYVKLSICIRT